MRVHCHFCDVGQVNSYLVSLSDRSCPAMIVDPSSLDADLIAMIEKEDLDIRAILITHDHYNHVRDLGKYRKIYPCPVYAYRKEILGFETTMLRETKAYEIAGFKVDVIHLPGHSDDSLVYGIGHCIFTGDTLQAGRVSNTGGIASSSRLRTGIMNKLLSVYDDNVLVFPGHGPLTKIRIEKMFNHDILDTSVSMDAQLFQDRPHPLRDL